MDSQNWRDEMVAAAEAAGLRASLDEPDAVLMADSRNLLAPGSEPDRLAGYLADDLAAKAPCPVTRDMAAVLVRAVCNLRALVLLGYTSQEILTIGAAAAAKLEMRATS